MGIPNMDSATSPNSTAMLDSMVSQNGTDAGEGYSVGEIGWGGGKDWLALFFMTFGKDLSSDLLAARATQPIGDHHRTAH